MKNKVHELTKEKEPAKLDLQQEEENKADCVFAKSNNESQSGLNPTSSIFGDKKINTIFIQKIPPQNECMNKNKYSQRNPLDNHHPFITFPNIIDKNCCNGPTGHPFFDSFFLAFVLHGEIVLSPDDIWLQINSCFAQYVNKFSENLRSKIVKFHDKKDLIVFYDVTDSAFQNIRDKFFRWDIIISNFSKLIKKNTIENISDLIECNFSTTGPIEKIASQVSLMHTCEKFFNYRMGGKGCGIRKVHFLGEAEDWENLKTKLLRLKTYSLEPYDEFNRWIDRLEKVLDKFIETYEEYPDVKFWNEIVIQFEGYEYQVGPSKGGFTESTFINGWILDFFLFDKNENYFCDSLIDRPLEKPESNANFEKRKAEKNGKYKKGAKLNCFPLSVWKAPVLIEFGFGPQQGKKIAVNFLAGFTGVLNEDDSYRPQISFGVADRLITDEEKTFKPLFK